MQNPTQTQPPAASERVGPAFSVDGMLRARNKTRQAIEAIAGRIQPGMVEEDAVAMAKQTLIDAGMALSWHPTRVRFGANTMKAMRQASTPGAVLGDNDIFFLDIAPPGWMPGKATAARATWWATTPARRAAPATPKPCSTTCAACGCASA